MSKDEALAQIKALRDRLMAQSPQTATSENWELDVAEALDRAADLIEFPK